MKKKILAMLILCSTVSVFSACGILQGRDKGTDKEITSEEKSEDKNVEAEKDSDKEENKDNDNDKNKDDKDNKKSSSSKGAASSIEKPLSLDEEGKIEMKIYGGEEEDKYAFVTMAIEDIYRGKDAEKYVEQFNNRKNSGLRIGELEENCEYFVIEYTVEAPELEEKEVIYGDLDLEIKGVDGETLKVDNTRYYLSAVGMEENNRLKSEEKLDKMYLISQIPKKADEISLYFDKNGREGSYYLYKK
ncbi:MAG: hypothetical protein ACRCWM_05300 [Sarcina sp.]